MNKYMELVLSRNNEFKCKGSFVLDGIQLLDLEFKIDTGCPYSSIPLLRTPLDDETIHLMMHRDYSDDTIRKHISFGVNDLPSKREADKKLFADKEYEKINSITCDKVVNDFTMSKVGIGDIEVRISYKRTGNILIGMDILKRFDIHMATLKDGRTIMLGCLLDRMNDAYLRRLEELCKMGSKNLFSI